MRDPLGLPTPESLEALDRFIAPATKAALAYHEALTRALPTNPWAKELERSSDHHMQVHNVFARTVTILQIAIAMAAISVLSKKKWLWLAGVGLSVLGVVSMGQAFL